MSKVPLDEPIKPHGFIRFLIIFVPILVFRFYIGETQFSFYWFVILYFPMMNYLLYWTMSSVRVLLNKRREFDWITVAKLRKFYKWYLNVPGSLVISEIVFQGYLYNFTS